MFGLFKKKNQLEKLIDKDGIGTVTTAFAEVVASKLPTREIAYQFVLEELESASMGNGAGKRFARDSGIPSEEYEGSLNNSNIDVDGPEGPQQLLISLSSQLLHDVDHMVRFRCGVDDKIMRKYGFGKYAPDNGAGEASMRPLAAKDRLVGLVQQKYTSPHGVFSRILMDIEDFRVQSGDAHPLILLAYAHAYRICNAALYIKGSIPYEGYSRGESFFASFRGTIDEVVDKSTGGSLEWNTAAVAQANELVMSYMSGIDATMMEEIVDLALRSDCDSDGRCSTAAGRSLDDEEVVDQIRKLLGERVCG